MSKNGGFITGVLTVNNGVQHAILDIEQRKKTVKGSSVVYLYTSDVPPIPIRDPSDSFKVEFFLENITNLSDPTRMPLVEEIFLGTAVDPSLPGTEQSVRTTNGEWKLRRRMTSPDTPSARWMFSEIQLRVPDARIKQYLS